MDQKPSPTTDLGPVVGAFGTSRANLAAGGVLALLSLAGGGILIDRIPLQEPHAVTFFYALAAACITGSLAFLAFAFRLAYTRVTLCQSGFQYHSLAGVDEVTWDNVDHIQLHATAQDGARVDPSVSVLTKGGKAYHITANHVSDMPAFVNLLGELTNGYPNLWETTTAVSKSRRGIVFLVIGLFTMVFAPLIFLDIDRAERNAGGQPLKVNSLIFLLYKIGGKWLVGGGLFTLGLTISAWGLLDVRKSKSPSAKSPYKMDPGGPPDAGPETHLSL